MADRLKDPYSARYSWLNTPTKGYFMWTIGYVVCATINAKNSYGGYAGQELFAFFIDKGVVVDMFQGGIAKAVCEKAARY